jgi:O-antigen/teichoic acid export membrane protein
MSMDSERRGLISNLNWVLASSALAGTVNFLAIVWFARTLGPAVMGDYATIVVAVQFIAAFLSAGFDQALIRAPRDTEMSAAANIATVGQSILLLATSALVYLVYFTHAPAGALHVIWSAGIVVGAMIVSLFANLFAAPVAADMDYRFIGKARLVSMLVGVGGGLILASMDFGLYALAARDVLGALVLLLLIRMRTKRRTCWTFSRVGFQRLFRFSRGMWALNFLERIALRLDYAIVATLFGKEMLGMYFVIRGLVEGVIGFLIQPVQTVLYAYYCRRENERKLASPKMGRLAFFYWIFCAALSLLAWFAAPKAVSMLLGASYSGASVIVPGLMLYAGGLLWFENVKVLAMSQQTHFQLIYARLAQLAVFVLTMALLAQRIGLAGAGIATALGGLALATVASNLVPRRSRLPLGK